MPPQLIDSNHPVLRLRPHSARLCRTAPAGSIRSFPLAHPSGFPSMSSIPMNSIVEELQAALAQFAEIAADLKQSS